MANTETTVYAENIRALLDAPYGRDAVLYLDDDGAISVWTAAHVAHARRIATAADVLEWIGVPPGEEPTADEIADVLDTVQEHVDRITHQA